MTANNLQQTASATGGPDWASSHVYGDCSVNHFRKLYYVNIPKCASSWVKDYLARLGTTENDIWLGSNFVQYDLTSYTPLICLRDPLKRFISHSPMNPGILNAVKNPGLVEDVLLNFKSLLHDEHTALQTSFCQGINLDNAIFFYCDNSLTDNFSHYLTTQNFRSIVAPDMVNVSLSDPVTISVKECWANIFNQPKYMKEFCKVYQNDYDLIEKVQFYRV